MAALENFTPDPEETTDESQPTIQAVKTEPMALPVGFGADEPEAALEPNEPIEPSEAENYETAVKYLSIIVEELSSGDPDKVQAALDKLKNLSAFMADLDYPGEELADFINTNLITPLCQVLLTNPNFESTFVSVLTDIFVQFQVKTVRGNNTKILGTLVNNVDSQLGTNPDTKNAISAALPRIIVDSCLRADNLHNIIRTLRTVDDSNSAVIEGVYSIIFKEIITSNIEARRLAEFIVDALREAILDSLPLSTLIVFISRIESSPNAETIYTVIGKTLDIDHYKNIFETKLRSLIIDDSTAESDRKILIEFAIKIGGFKFVAKLVGISGKLDNSAQLIKIFVYIEPYIEGVLDSGNQEDISALVEYMGQVSLRIDFVQTEWVDIQVNILNYIDRLKQTDNVVISEVLTDVLLKSITSRIIAGLQSTLATSQNEDTQKAIRRIVRLVVPVGAFAPLSIFDKDDRVAVYKLFIERYLTDPKDSYLFNLMHYLYSGEVKGVNLEDLTADGYEFQKDKDAKIELVAELVEALKLSEEQKKAIIDKFFENHSANDTLVITLLLRETAMLEYYREKAYQIDLVKKLGTQEIESELEEIKELVLDRLRPEGKAERMKQKVNNLKKNIYYRILFAFDSEPTKAQKRREKARESVESEDKRSIEKGVRKLADIIKDPIAVKLLIKAVETDPEAYATVANLIEELYQFVDELDVSRGTERSIYDFLRLSLDSVELVTLMPPHVRVIKLEMWKDRLDQLEDISENYGASKKEILTEDGIEVRLDALKAREQRWYESRLAKKFKALSTPRGECLTEIVTLYSTNRPLFDIYSSQPEFENIVEYAIDQYSMYPDKFLQISDAEKDFILFIIDNKSIWNSVSNRVKFKLCTQVLTLWSKQDPAGYEILIDLATETDDSVDYSFANADVLNFIGATFQQLPAEQRDQLIRFAGVNEKKGRARKMFEGLRDTVTRNNTNDYANNLNYIMAYLATRNRVNAKGFYDVVDTVVAEKATVEQQVKIENAAHQAYEDIKDEAGEVDPTGALLTNDRVAELDTKLKKSIDASIVFIDAFNMNPPLTFRVQTEVLDMIPRFIDLLVHGVERGYDEIDLKKVLDFMQKLLETEPPYFRPSRTYIEILEEIDSRVTSYSQLTGNAKFDAFNKDIKAIRDLCEKKSIEAAGLIVLGAFEKLKSPFAVSNKDQKVATSISVNLLKSSQIREAIKPVIEILFSNFEIIEKLIKNGSEEDQDRLVLALSRVLMYVNLYVNPSISKQLTFFITKLGSALPKEKRAEIVSMHKFNQENVRGLSPRRRVLPITLQEEINKLAA